MLSDPAINSLGEQVQDAIMADFYLYLTIRSAAAHHLLLYGPAEDPAYCATAVHCLALLACFTTSDSTAIRVGKTPYLIKNIVTIGTIKDHSPDITLGVLNVLCNLLCISLPHNAVEFYYGGGLKMQETCLTLLGRFLDSVILQSQSSNGDPGNPEKDLETRTVSKTIALLSHIFQGYTGGLMRQRPYPRRTEVLSFNHILLMYYCLLITFSYSIPVFY
jgi:hypothetical protein